MNKNYTPHDYKFAKALQESLAQDVENKKSLFKNPEDMPNRGFLPTNPIYGNQ